METNSGVLTEKKQGHNQADMKWQHQIQNWEKEVKLCLSI